jgi:hypothetical protein
MIIFWNIVYFPYSSVLLGLQRSVANEAWLHDINVQEAQGTHRDGAA